jgi:hypothetical protein
VAAGDILIEARLTPPLAGHGYLFRRRDGCRGERFAWLALGGEIGGLDASPSGGTGWMRW